MVRWMSRDGLTDEQMAEKLGISARQLYRWYRDYPELRQSKEEGAETADYKVEDSLYKLACGHTVTDTEKIVTKDGTMRVKQIEREIPPNATAAVFWLKNRKPGKWRDVRQVDMQAEVANPFEGVTIDELRELRERLDEE